ncbi:unnamed protein product [Microthlaspi erraticum]|uniref:Uncharacterized protein n=1 Tax=Microthlaspi erraticum TaxID=1685480 RepID=A0A6D2L5S1_9BRAS|nr:unnamed protein product [Microthlaspi erraticum]
MDFVAVERFGRPNFVLARDFGRGRVCFPDRPAVGPFRYKIGRSRPILPGSCVRANVLSRDEIRPSTAIPSRLDRDGRPGWKLLGQNFFARPRPMFGADCVFTPFSPSILS